MKYNIFKLTALSLLILVSFAFTLTVNSFTATYQGSDVHLDWKVDNDNEIVGMELYRRKTDETTFTRITTVNSNGSGTYSYIDEGLYKKASDFGGSGTLEYKLQIKSLSGNVQATTRTSSGPTAVQRSWGSIKTMFK